MEYKKSEYGYQVRLVTGEEIHASLAKFMDETGITGGTIIGIGALSSYSLGYLDFQVMEYVRHDYDNEVELITCTGNLAMKAGKPIAHLHAMVTDTDMKPIGGHLFEAVISATGEFSVLNAGVGFERQDVTKGLPLMDLTK